MNGISRRLLATLAALAAAVLSPALLAQTGILSGRVTDTGVGVGLSGAQVTVVGLGIQTATNPEGEFVLVNLPPGEHEVEVSYVGYGTTREKVNVVTGERTVMRVRLQTSDVVKLDAYVVAGIREGSARAFNEQRSASNLMNIVASDAIGQFPDANTAEALQRIVGVAVERDQGEGRYIQIRGAPTDFAAVSVDGISLPGTGGASREIDLDTIPSDIINTLEVIKTPLADQDADMIGGRVNITTGSAFAYDGLRVRASLGHGYNELGGTGDTRGTLMASNVFGADRNFGVMLSASKNIGRRKLDNMEPNWDQRVVGGRETWVVTNFGWKHYDAVRTRTGLTGQLEWRPAVGHRLYLRGSYNEFIDNEKRNRLLLVLSDGQLQPGATDRTGTWNNARLTKHLRDTWRRNEIESYSAGGEHQIGAGTLDYVGSYSRSMHHRPKQHNLLYRTANNIPVSYDFTRSSDFPEISLFRTREHLEYNRFEFREMGDSITRNEAEEYAAMANYKIPVQVAGYRTLLKFGAKVRSQEKERNSAGSSNLSRLAQHAPPSLESVLGGVIQRNFMYEQGRGFDSTKTDPYFASVLPQLQPYAPSLTAFYKFGEDIQAGYGMAAVDLGKLDVIAGVRVERTEWYATANRIDSRVNSVTRHREERSYTKLFPGLTFRYAFSEMMIGRAAVTRGINRPSHSNLTPQIREDDPGAGDFLVRVRSGNPDLQPTMSTNFDLGLEYYLKPMGIVSGGLFHKEIDNYRFLSITPGTWEGQPARIERAENAHGGELRGIELAYHQQLTFLPGALAGLGLTANATFTRSEVQAPTLHPVTGLASGFRKTKLPGQSGRSYNAAIFYEARGFNIRLAYNTRTDYLQSISIAGGADDDTWWEGRSQLDLTSTYRLTRRIQLFLEARNLTDTKGVRYDGVRERIQEVEKFGAIYFAGVRFNL
jgi:TonB-dependent receptor